MSGAFTSSFFKGNRDNLRAMFAGTAPIVLAANGLVQSSSDSTFPFRQDSNFWYLTGLNDPDLVLVLDRTKEYLILPHRERVQELFSGAFDNQQLSATSGIEMIVDNKTGWKQLESRLKKVKHIATLAPLPAFVDTHGFYTNPARAVLLERVRSSNSSIEVLDLRQHLAALRMVKQPIELLAIKQAIAVTTKTVKRVFLSRSLLARATEQAIENELTYNFRKLGADGAAFDSIVASGANSCVIHHSPQASVLEPSGVLLIDVGAEVNHYAADISRTYYIGRPSKRLRQVYEATIDVHTYARSLLKPGVIIRTYEKEIEKYMGEKLRELGLIKTIDHESVRQYFPHATSHHLGLDAHDAADYDKPLQSDMVLAVEPGIYIPEEGIGIRIEDNVLITPDGNKVLTAGLSRELQSLTIR